MSVNSLIETSASAPPPIIQQRYGNNNSIIQKPIPIQRNGVLKIRELRPWIRGFDITCIILQHCKHIESYLDLLFYFIYFQINLSFFVY